MAISTVALKSGKTDEVRFNVWDFGGQVIFYSTHQFFLTPKAIYILAFDLSEPQFDRIEYWMWYVPFIMSDSSHRHSFTLSSLLHSLSASVSLTLALSLSSLPFNPCETR